MLFLISSSSWQLLTGQVMTSQIICWCLTGNLSLFKGISAVIYGKLMTSQISDRLLCTWFTGNIHCSRVCHRTSQHFIGHILPIQIIYRLIVRCLQVFHRTSRRVSIGQVMMSQIIYQYIVLQAIYIYSEVFYTLPTDLQVFYK